MVRFRQPSACVGVGNGSSANSCSNERVTLLGVGGGFRVVSMPVRRPNAAFLRLSFFFPSRCAGWTVAAFENYDAFPGGKELREANLINDDILGGLEPPPQVRGVGDAIAAEPPHWLRPGVVVLDCCRG